MITTKDGVDIARLVRLHRQYHGIPVACAVRRHREEIAKRQECSLTEADEGHGRDHEPQGHQDQRGRVFAQAGDEARLARIESGNFSSKVAG